MKSIIAISSGIFFAGIIIFSSCKKETSCENCADKKKPPIAIAGPDQVITLPTDSISLDGSSSSDPDGKISVWLWTKISGPVSFNIMRPSDSLTKVKNLIVGVYQFELKVTDNGGLSASDTVQITVNDRGQTNRPPVANAGADQTITLPTNTVNINGSGSGDPDNNIISYAWTKISGPSSFNIATANAVQTQVTLLVQGVYRFELKVIDSGGLFSMDTMQVMINAILPNNMAPVANAGQDISLNYDLQTCSMNPSSILLNGSASTDPDGNIVSYHWAGSGPISNPNSVITHVTDLMPQINMFILTVTDNNGATDADTIFVTVTGINRQTINLQLIPFGTLSIARAGISSATAGNKILFAGGYTTNGTPGSGIVNWYSRVDIYDISTQTWSIAELSIARTQMAVATLGNKIFFAGGYTSADDATNRVDIYDASNNTWSTADLSQSRISLSAASAGNKVFFGGGCLMSDGGCPSSTSRVDIYDSVTNSWSVAELSEARMSLAATSVGNKVFFGGGLALPGYSSRVDIYDVSSNSWLIETLSEARGELMATTLNNKVFFAGGSVSFGDIPAFSNKVDVYNSATQNWSVECLSQPRIVSGIGVLGARILFFPHGTRVDIYDESLNGWFISDLNQPLYNSTVVGAAGQVYIAGGALSGNYVNYTSQVWRVQF